MANIVILRHFAFKDFAKPPHGPSTLEQLPEATKEDTHYTSRLLD